MAKLKILFVSSEVAPFARTGGLGDVLGALPRTLAKQGHDIKVCLPKYKAVGDSASKLVRIDWSAPIEIGGNIAEAAAYRQHNNRPRMDYYFVDNDYFFNRPELYRDPKTGKDYKDNLERFLFFDRAVLELVKHLNWRPDVIHCHDWQASLLPAYLKTAYADDRLLRGCKTILTIHNLGYQGIFPADLFDLLDLPGEYNRPVTGPLEFYGKLNLLKVGIVTADALTTVSPRYAVEISTPEYGCGLEGVLRQRGDALHGILNGVDYSIWSPSRDAKIPYRYSRSNLSGKRMILVELMGKAGLPIRDGTPVIGMISRLADQKGWDLIAEAAERLFAMNLQMIVLGTGDQKYHKLLRKLERKYPDKLKAYLTFNDSLAHWIEAGADMFLMPSRYEPCGLNQMYSLKYGTVPIVREVGGLADTVSDYQPETGEGTGFVFRDYSADELLNVVKRAVDVFARRRTWTKLMKSAMAEDFSWEASAKAYSKLYQEISDQ
jgi:starch synthase